LGNLTEVWRGSFDGCFSVKSAYHLAVSRRAQEKGESSKEVADGHIWRAIWRLGITPATRHFCWKVCHNLLPTMVNLSVKQVVHSLDCPICLREPETVVHRLWSCPSAVAVWQECSKRLQKLALIARDGKELTSFFLEKLDDSETVEAFVVARMIWLRRNSLVYGNKFQSPQRVVKISKVAIKEFSEAQYDRARVPLSQWPLLTIIGRNLLEAYERLIVMQPSTKIL